MAAVEQEFTPQDNLEDLSLDHMNRRTTSLSESPDAKLSFIVSPNNIEVKLVNQAPISMLGFGIKFENESALRPITIIPRIQSVGSSMSFQDALLKIDIFDMDGRGIPIGAGTIACIPLECGQDFRVDGAYVSTRSDERAEVSCRVFNEESPYAAD